MDPAPDRLQTIEALSQRFRIPLARFFEKRIGHRAEVEDLVQEVFLRLAGNRHIESVDQPEAYLFRTAANLLVDRNRRRVARSADAHESYDDSLHGTAPTTADPQRQLLDMEALGRVITALQGLPDRTRVVWALYHLEGKSHAEIAWRLGIAISTIEKRMHRANVELLKCLDEES
jgi:RNA polymerase sigma-70 factor (ECF subfamily)